MDEVGLIGSDVPHAVVERHGARARRLLLGPDVGPDRASRAGGAEYRAVAVLGAARDPWAHALLADLLDGRWRHLAGILLGRGCEAALQLFYALRELRRLEPALGLPPVHLLDTAHLPREPSLRYDEAALRRVAGQVLPAWLGPPRPGAGVAAPAGPQVEAALAGGRLAGSRAHELHVLDVVEGPRAALAALHSALQDGARQHAGPPPGGARVFLTGSAQDRPDVQLALEAAGHRVVGDDVGPRRHLPAGAGLPGTPDLADPPDPDLAGLTGPAGLAGLALAIRDQHLPSAATSTAARVHATVAAALAARADLVLSYVRTGDEAPGWDVPALRRALAANGVPLVVMQHQPLVPDRAAVAAAVSPGAVATAVSPVPAAGQVG